MTSLVRRGRSVSPGALRGPTCAPFLIFAMVLAWLGGGLGCEGSQTPGNVDGGLDAAVDGARADVGSDGAGAGLEGGANDGAPVPGGSLIVASWALEHVGVPGILLDCGRAGTPEVILDVAPREGGTPSTKSFSCAGSLGFSDAVLPGRYDVAVALLDGDQQPVGITAVRDLQVLPRMAVTLPPIVFAVQAWWPTWTITRASAPTTPVSCSEAGAVQVDLVVTAPGASPTSYVFPCGAIDAFTPAIRLGPYEVRAELKGAGGVVLAQWTSPPVAVTETVRAELAISFSLP